MAVKLSDIAKATGVSINTVSRVVTGKKDVSAETRKKIEECIQSMGYVGNSAAKQLRTGHNSTIVFIADNFVNPKYSLLLDEIVLYAGKLNYSVMVYSTYGDVNVERKIIEKVINDKVAGILIIPIQKGNHNRELIIKSRIPTVLIERAYDEYDRELSVIVYDEFRIGVLIGELLVKKGISEIAIINSEEFVKNVSKRVDGIRRITGSYGVVLNIKNNINLPLNEKTWLKVFESSPIDTEEVGAIICYDDIAAMKIKNYLASRSKKIPLIVGCGNIVKYYMLNDITTVDCAIDKISVCAVDMLIKKMQGEQPEMKVLGVKLVESEM